MVFDKASAIGSNGKNYFKGTKNTDSPSSDSTRTPTLTEHNLEKHTSKWSTMNVLQRFWKKKVEPQSPVDKHLEIMSANMVLDEWTPHEDNVSGTSNVHVDDMDVVWDHADQKNPRPDPSAANQTVDVTILSKEENKLVPQDTLFVVSTNLPVATPFMPFPFLQNDSEAFATLRREPLQVSMMTNQITPTPMQNQTQTSNGGNSPMNLKSTTLFPESCKAKDGSAASAFGDVTIALPTNSSPTILHRSISSGNAYKGNSASNCSPSKSNSDTFVDCRQSECSGTMLSEDDDVFMDAYPTEIAHMEPFITQNGGGVVELQYETLSILEVLFFAFQNADTVPEMSRADIASWYEHHHTVIGLWSTTNSALYLHDALFGGLWVLNPDSANDTFTFLLWYNWLLPMLTLCTAILLFCTIATENRFLIVFIDVLANRLHHDDPSHGLLAPLTFVGTDFGYIGTVCIE